METVELICGIQLVREMIKENIVLVIFCGFLVVLSLQLFNNLIKEVTLWTIGRLFVSLQVTGGCNPDLTPNGIFYRRILTFLGKHCEVDLQQRHISFFDATNTSGLLNHYQFKFDFLDDNEYPAKLGSYFGWGVARRIFTLTLGAGYGLNYVRYRGSWLKVTRKPIDPYTTARPYAENKGGGTAYSKRVQELLAITTFAWNRNVLLDIVETLKPKVLENDNSKLTIYQPDTFSYYWESLSCNKRKRRLETIILDDDVAENVISDAKNFLSSRDWYLSKGIPFRRHYLFYGPPGCGKSSIVKAIAGEMNYGICNFSLSHKTSDSKLIELFNWTPKDCVILLEDIDAAFATRNLIGASGRELNLAYEGQSASKLTFGGLLNVLDGVASAENGQIVFMTTNYPERLDPALLRPGRIDMKIHMDWPSDSQILGLCKKFYYEEEQRAIGPEILKRVKAHRGAKISLAMLQGLMVVYKRNSKKALDNFDQHFKDFYSK